MQRRTFEIISKYISHSNGAKIIFDGKGDGATTDTDTGEIHMPDSVGEKNVFAVLALLMHESAHIRYSKEALENCVDKDSATEKHIFNCIEDVRIDRKNFNKLSNVRGFYERLVKDHCDYSKNTDDIKFQIKILITAILRREGFYKYGFLMDPAVGEFLDDNPLEQLIEEAIREIEYTNWTEAKKKIKEIKDMLKMAEGKSKGKGKGKGQDPLNGIELLLKPGTIFSDKGTSLTGASASQIGEAALEEQTISQFKELLNIKEKKIIEDGTMLDTDNLTAYLTGEIEELFKDDSYIKCKKSKILFLMDSSGSMSEMLLDKNPRWKIVSKCVERLTRVLKEVQETEGINVDWEVAKFESYGMQLLSKDNWQLNYRPSGGTALALAFTQAIEHLEKDFTIDGKKMIIVMTDGDVNIRQIDDMKRDIINHNTDVKALIIGIGTDPTGAMALKICGNNLILAEENANEVLLETIRSLL